jgi:hypothetical protein
MMLLQEEEDTVRVVSQRRSSTGASTDVILIGSGGKEDSVTDVIVERFRVGVVTGIEGGKDVGQLIVRSVVVLFVGCVENNMFPEEFVSHVI